MNLLKILSLIVVLSPLASAVVVGLFNKRFKPSAAHWSACVLLGICFIASFVILLGLLLGKFNDTDINIYTWGHSSNLVIPVGFLIDRLSAVMITVVSFVSLMVHIYSIGYMHEDTGYQRFFSYISLFTFAMLMLVMSNNLAQLFFGWEGVGLLSYLLIGFYYQKESANFASLKAFIVNRIGDLGFVLGIAAILFYFNSLQYKEIFSQMNSVIELKPTIKVFSDVQWSAISFICFSLFVGAMAKSAQVPLHVWLPDSMEGPTPISALIHAATMVTAGIFMVARFSPIFEYSDVALSFMLFIGAITCFFMGVLAVVQSDIKRVIAYSTLSQLGYMVVALGASAYSAAIFHLITHAFFKALLFLAAGSAIMAMHHDQDIFNMGNLRKYMPISFATMLIGGLALSGFPGTSGYFSKDLIIAATKLSNQHFSKFGYWMTLLSVVLTTIYTFRMIYLVFFSKERMKPEIKATLHESPKVVWVPLVILAIPSLILGMFLISPVLNNFFGDAIFVLPQHNTVEMFRNDEFHGVIHMFAHGFLSWPFLCILGGFLLVWICYIKYPQMPTIIGNDAKPLTFILKAKYGFDALNEKLIMPCMKSLGKYFWRFGDVICIDGVMVNGTANNIGKFSLLLKRLQTGYLYHYVFIIMAGVLTLIIWTFYI